MNAIKKWLIGWLRGGHFTVGDPSDPYMLRWYVIPRNPWFNIYLHKFLRDDEDRAMHDHPWASLSVLVVGCYVEQTATGKKLYRWLSIIWRGSNYVHRVELPGGIPAWTLFITGPRVREWGFHCPKGWVHWSDFVSPSNIGNVGKGCGEMS